jgi:signal transduction histidine kinase
MQGYVETLMMKKDQLSATDIEKYLMIVYDSNRKLSVLVEQLFQYARLEANLVTPQKESFLIDELASDILAAYQLKAKTRNIDLQLETSGNLPPVFADLALTERVFQNLLDNAFKFTNDGGSVTVQLTQTRAGVRVNIVDTGIGIAAEDQSFIFERYKQLTKEHTPQKGMGIGLAIVKKILELHQASIDVFSEPGKGTTFQFELPYRSGPVHSMLPGLA